MAVPREQFAYKNAHRTPDFKQRIYSWCAIVFENSGAARNIHKRPGCENSSLDRIINKRYAIIALFIMLILVLMLQTPVCCDGVAASEQALSPAVEQPSQPAQTPEAIIKNSDKPIAEEIEPATVRPVINEPVKVTTAPAAPPLLELVAIAPVSGYEQADTGVENDTQTNAKATVASIAGSGFVKISNSGETLDDKAVTWECVEDKSSKLIWEVKKNDGGIRDKDYSYSWLRNINGEVKGVSNGGRCRGGVKCDTYSYVHALNEQKLCGYSDWRLPTREEMETLIDYNTSVKDATINTTYFPEAVPSWYWTATENPQRDNFAWYVLFRNGIALNDLKERPKHVRLVRGNRKQQENHAATIRQ